MKLLESAPVQFDWFHRKRRLGHKHTQRKDHESTQGEDGHLQGKAASEETSSSDTLILELQPPKM